jgi:hypothetical protein
MMIAETIPETLEAAVDSLYASLAEDEKAYMRTSESTPGQQHMWGGMALRNRWGLWRDSVLARHFKDRFGLGCADDMSAMILKSLWAKVRGAEYEANADAAYYHAFWKRQGRSPITGAAIGPPAPPEDRGFLRPPIPPRDRYKRTVFDKMFEFFGALFGPASPNSDPGGIR